MKKSVFFISLFMMGSLTISSVMGQTPVSRASSPNRSSSTSNSQVDRQVRKGDAQLSKANDSYQRAQNKVTGTASAPSSRPASSSSSNRQNTVPPTSVRPSSSSTSVSRTTSTSTNTRPATSSSTNRQNSSVSSPSATRPSSSTTVKPSSNSTSVSRTPSSTTVVKPSSSATSTDRAPKPTTASTTANSQNVSNRTNTPSATTSSSSAAEPKRGYTEGGRAQPQPAPANYGGPRGGNDNAGVHTNVPKPKPYMHPNHHNFGHHIMVPNRIRPVYYGGIPYYFYNSSYCRYINGFYVICRPPVGAVIAHTIFHTWSPVVVVYKNVHYYYDDGTFYSPRQQDYVVVNPPIGARVAELPSNYEEIVLDGYVYFKVDNVYYKEVIVSGYIWYEVIFVS